MRKYKRYVVVGSRKLVEHGYSTDLGGQNALNFAIECADHHTMKGRVFGECEDGSREPIYTFQEDNSKDK